MRTILHIDNNDNIRDFWNRRFEEGGYLVVSMPNGEAALHALKTVRCDVVVLDMGIPGNGDEVIDWIVAHGGTPVVIYAANEEYARYMGKGPVKAFVNKTADPEVLLNKVAEVLAAQECRGSEAPATDRQAEQEADHGQENTDTGFWG